MRIPPQPCGRRRGKFGHRRRWKNVMAFGDWSTPASFLPSFLPSFRFFRSPIDVFFIEFFLMPQRTRCCPFCPYLVFPVLHIVQPPSMYFSQSCPRSTKDYGVKNHLRILLTVSPFSFLSSTEYHCRCLKALLCRSQALNSRRCMYI